MENLEYKGRKIRAIRFSHVANAVRFADGCEKLMVVVLAECPAAYVCTPADAQRLEKMGYEIY